MHNNRTISIGLALSLLIALPVRSEQPNETTPLLPTEKLPAIQSSGAELRKRFELQQAQAQVSREVVGLMKRDHDGSIESATRINLVIAMFAQDAARTLSATFAASQRTIESIKVDRNVKQRTERRSQLEYEALKVDVEQRADEILGLEDKIKAERNPEKRAQFEEQRADKAAEIEDLIAQRDYNQRNAKQCHVLVDNYDAELKGVEIFQHKLTRTAKSAQGSLVRLYDAISSDVPPSASVVEDRRLTRDAKVVIDSFEPTEDMRPVRINDPARETPIKAEKPLRVEEQKAHESAAAREEIERARQRRGARPVSTVPATEQR